jgi:hypothetical protein
MSKSALAEQSARAFLGVRIVQRLFEEESICSH